MTTYASNQSILEPHTYRKLFRVETFAFHHILEK